MPGFFFASGARASGPLIIMLFRTARGDAAVRKTMSGPEARAPVARDTGGPLIGHATAEADCLPSVLPKHLTESGGACRQPDHGTFQGCVAALGVGIAPVL